MREKRKLILAFLFLNLIGVSCSTVMTSESMRYCGRVCESRGGFWGVVSDVDSFCICEDGTKAKVYK